MLLLRLERYASAIFNIDVESTLKIYFAYAENGDKAVSACTVYSITLVLNICLYRNIFGSKDSVI